MMNLKALKEQALQNPEVKTEYERLAPEFVLASTLISMRQRAGLTQEELAKRLDTQKVTLAAWSGEAVTPAGKHYSAMHTPAVLS